MTDSPGAATAFACKICGKGSASETALKRHLRYCRKRTTTSKSRTKSCVACIRAKTRCEPGVAGCQRCRERRLLCSLSSSRSSDSRAAIPDNSVVLRQNESVPDSQFRESDVLNGGNAFSESLLPFNFLALESASSNNSPQENAPTVGLTSANPFSIDSVNVPISGTGFPYQKLFEPKTFHTVSAMMASTVGTGILRSYPGLMRENRTFPPFIHHCYRSEDNGWTMPLALRNVKAISESFVNDSPDTVDRIRRERQRLFNQSDEMGFEDLLASSQAIIIYLLMRIANGPSDDEEDVQLVRTLWHVCSQIVKKAGNPSLIRQMSPWKYWILVESKRRVTGTLRLMMQLYNLDIGLPCPYADKTTATPLPASKLLWLAKSEQDWQQELEKDEFYMQLSPDDLMKFKGSTENNFPTREEWARWYAGADELGILVVISTSLL